MPHSTPQAPPAPAPSTAPAVPSGGQAAPAVPQTRTQLDALQMQRSELQTQLRDLTARRKELQQQSSQMTREAAQGHVARIAQIDARSATIEAQLLRVDEAIATGVAQGAAQADAANAIEAAIAEGLQQGLPGGLNRTTTALDPAMRRAIDNAVEGAVIGTLAGGAMIFLSAVVLWKGFRRFIWKRKPALPDQTVRLSQLQQSVDVIALEVERISEAQRFVAKVLNEKLPEISAGAAQPVSARSRDAERAGPGSAFDR